MTQDPFDLPSPKKPDRSEWSTETYAPSKSEQLHSTLEEVLEEQKDRLQGGRQW